MFGTVGNVTVLAVIWHNQNVNFYNNDVWGSNDLVQNHMHSITAFPQTA